MKKILIGMLVLVAGYAFAGNPPTYIKISDTNVDTNATATASSTNTYGSTVGTTVTPIKVSGKVLGVVVDFSGASSPDVDIDLQTRSGQAIPIARTIFSINDIAADAEYDVRNSATTTAGVDFTDIPAPIVLIDDYIDLIIYDANKTNINIDVYLILE